jgi:hypothetical protein
MSIQPPPLFALGCASLHVGRVILLTLLGCSDDDQTYSVSREGNVKIYDDPQRHTARR